MFNVDNDNLLVSSILTPRYWRDWIPIIPEYDDFWTWECLYVSFPKSPNIYMLKKNVNITCCFPVLVFQQHFCWWMSWKKNISIPSVPHILGGTTCPWILMVSYGDPLHHPVMTSIDHDVTVNGDIRSPVRTVPWPLMAKAWSKANLNR